MDQTQPTLDYLIKSVDVNISYRTYRDDRSKPVDAIDDYISARYEEIKGLKTQADRLIKDDNLDEAVEKMRRARYLTRNLAEAVRYLRMYESLFPEASAQLTEEAIPDVIMDMILLEVKDHRDVQPTDVIDDYISARFKEIRVLREEAERLIKDDDLDEASKKMDRARYLTRNLAEAVKYLKRYESLFPEA
ncbi:hypothetical protein KY331_03115, partial [Candidatus Woesearchaeota archaeon]|nr:hypothetical protein [Candidatus Woesearchaeota archaeon]